MSSTSLYETTPQTGTVSSTNLTSLYSNTTNFTSGVVNSSVYSVNGGTGVTVDPTTGNVVVSIGQDVATTANVTFATVTLANGAVLKDTAGEGVAFGQGAGTTSQGAQGVAIGYQAGQTSQSAQAIAIGRNAGGVTQGIQAVAIGDTAGLTNQGANAMAFGQDSGKTNQGAYAIAFGGAAGYDTQGTHALAFGNDAGRNFQGTYTTAIGDKAGNTSQGNNATAIGRNAGFTSQGTSAVAIGYNAGAVSQAARTIILNATGSVVNGVSAQTDSFYVAPIRNAVGASGVLQYDATTKEVSYSSSISGSATFGNVTVGVVDANTVSTTTGNLVLDSASNIVSINNSWFFSSDGTTQFPNYTFPYLDGTTGQVLKTDGSGNLSWVDGEITLGITDIALGSTALVLDGLTSVEVTQDPVTNLQLATKQYVDNIATTGLTFHQPVQAATTASLASITGGTVTYNQPGGPGVGVGATITLSNALTVLDGYTLLNTNRILVKDETNQTYNGVYTWATGGTVLTRATDADTYGPVANQLSLNDYFFVQNGTTQANIAYVLNAPVGAIVFGTSAITFAEFSRSTTYTGTTPIDVTGTVISLTTVPITLGGTGQITANAGLNALLPSQTANSGKYLTTDGIDSSWSTLPIDPNTTYTYTAGSTTGGANLTLTGSDATTNTVKLTNAGHITATYTSATEVTLGSDATDANTVSTIVARDASGNFSAGTITASLSGNATTATTANKVANALTAGTHLSGGPFDGSSAVTLTTDATSANTAGAIVSRDGSGNFSAAGATLGNITVGVTTDQTITTTSGDLILDSASGTIRVIPSQINSRNSTYTPVTIPLTAVTGLNNVAVASSTGGYFPDISVNNYLADTGGGNNGAGVTLRSTSGTTASPTGTANNQIIGSMNFDGYATGTGANWAGYISTAAGGTGGGAVYVVPLHAQGYARQAFTTTTLSTAVTGASGNGTTATLTFALQNVQPYFAGGVITVAGMTPSGYNGTYTITAATTTSVSYLNATTGFTSGGTISIPTVNAGTGFRIRGFANSTPLLSANRLTFADFNSAATTFKSAQYTFANEVITGSTLTATNYLTLASSGATFNQTSGTTNINNNISVKGDGVGNPLSTSGDVVYTQTRYSTSPFTYPLRISGKRTDNVNPQDSDTTGYQFQLFGSGSNFVNLGSMSMKYKTSGDNTIEFNLDNNAGPSVSTNPMTISAPQTVIRAGTNAAVSAVVTVNPTNVTFAQPIKFPAYTAATANTITGAVGWQISISDSPVNGGKMAYWDTTNNRWSYIDTNLAV